MSFGPKAFGSSAPQSEHHGPMPSPGAGSAASPGGGRATADWRSRAITAPTMRFGPWPDPRIPTRRMTCPDEILGTDRPHSRIPPGNRIAKPSRERRPAVDSSMAGRSAKVCISLPKSGSSPLLQQPRSGSAVSRPTRRPESGERLPGPDPARPLTYWRHSGTPRSGLDDWEGGAHTSGMPMSRLGASVPPSTSRTLPVT
jgi:hypothetical protein